ncbi:MAG: glycoside hydrolase family 3 protein [Actinomycetota bacterium]|nr:glycoside hydrolase family 3 protein [Actinomycetota bacterium]
MSWWRDLFLAAVLASSLGMASTMAAADPARPRSDAADDAAAGEKTEPTRAEMCEPVVAQKLGKLTLRGRIGQMIMASAVDGADPEATQALIRQHNVGSILITEQNSVPGTRRFNARLQRWAAAGNGGPLLIAADLEFGLAHKVHGTTVLPLQMGLGATRSPTDAATAARITAREARALGFHWALAPVADVNTNPENPVIGVRSFSSRRALVAQLTAAQVRTYESEGVIATPKHFPGHGSTEVDSHTGLPVELYDRAALQRIHLAPFEAAIEAGVDTIMTAHVVLRAIDPFLPATLSPTVLTDLLREEMGYDGVIVTDAMNMAAVADRWGTARGTVLAAVAGADVIMSVGTNADHVETIEELTAAVASGELDRRRVGASARRVLELKCLYGLIGPASAPPIDRAVVGSSEHAAAAGDLALRSITLVKNASGLPLGGDAEDTILVTGPLEADEIGGHIARLSRADVTTAETSEDPTAAEITRAADLATTADHIIVTTFTRDDISYSHAALVDALTRSGKPVTVVALGLPYDIRAFPGVDAYLTTYAQGPWPYPNPLVIEALAEVLLGAQPGGRLPVQIGDLYPYGHGLGYD